MNARRILASGRFSKTVVYLPWLLGVAGTAFGAPITFNTALPVRIWLES
ncbi:MAG TPA: hypothetical protein VK973_16670 [Arenicellales bacterium]|nr:hypothetical protein [Arenicellales bacterium]